MEKSKKLTIEELRKAQDLQAELLGMLSTKVGNKADWTVQAEARNVTTINEEFARLYVIINSKVFEAILTDWAMECTVDNLKANLTAYINKNFNTSIQ